MKDGQTIPAFPSWFPYNELLFTGRLSAKTRNWRWTHTGPTLLYTSMGTARDVARVHNLDPKSAPRGVLVGVGDLVQVRGCTGKEAEQIEREFCNNTGTVYVYAGPYLYKFNSLKRFKHPVSFKPPQGAVRLFHVPLSIVREALDEIGVSV
jgi:hypothetical protein